MLSAMAHALLSLAEVQPLLFSAGRADCCRDRGTLRYEDNHKDEANISILNLWFPASAGMTNKRKSGFFTYS
jgi:hypothetical protein